MKKLTFGLLGVVAIAATALLVRQQRQVVHAGPSGVIPAGETQPATISLTRMRELGL